MAQFPFMQTRSQLIERAFRLIGALSLGEVLSGEAMSQGVTALNAMVKSWQSDYVFLWTVKVLENTLLQGNSDYLLDAGLVSDVLTIDAAWIYPDGRTPTLELIGDQQQLERLSFRDYQQMLVDKTEDRGEPTHFAIDNQRSPIFSVYPIPDKDYPCFYLAVCKVKDWDTPDSTGDFPTQWIDALTYGLAANLGDEYGIPIGERQSLGQKAMALYKDARRSGRDQSDEDFVRGVFDR